MSALARPTAPVFGASVGERPFLKRQRGVSGVAPAACAEMSREKKFARGIVDTDLSAPPAPKRACRDFDVKIRESTVPAPASSRRMEAERDALGGLLRKAVLLSRVDASRSGVVHAGKHDARKSNPSVEAAAEVRKSCTASKPPSSAEVTKQSTEPKKKQPAVQRSAARTTNVSMASRIDQARDVMKKRRLEEIARARDKFRLYLLEVEKAAMPDETIYPEELEELGIAAFQYDVTRTRKQVLLGAG